MFVQEADGVVDQYQLTWPFAEMCGVQHNICCPQNFTAKIKFKKWKIASW